MACLGSLLYARCRWRLRTSEYRREFSLLGDLVVVADEVGECASLVGLLESVAVVLKVLEEVLWWLLDSS